MTHMLHQAGTKTRKYFALIRKLDEYTINLDVFSDTAETEDLIFNTASKHSFSFTD